MDTRKNIESLMRSGITTYRIAKETGIPEATVTRIWRGDTKLDNVKFGTIEKLENYYLKLKEMEKMKIKNDWEVIKSYVNTQLDDADMLELAQELFGEQDNLVNVVAESYQEGISAEGKENEEVEYLNLKAYLEALKERESWD